MKEVSRKIGEEIMKVMIFVDGLIVCEGCKSEVQEKLNKWVMVVAQFGMKFNHGKSEFMVIMRMENREEAWLVLGGEEMKRADRFTLEMQEDGKMDMKVNER